MPLLAELQVLVSVAVADLYGHASLDEHRNAVALPV